MSKVHALQMPNLWLDTDCLLCVAAHEILEWKIIPKTGGASICIISQIILVTSPTVRKKFVVILDDVQHNVTMYAKSSNTLHTKTKRHQTFNIALYGGERNRTALRCGCFDYQQCQSILFSLFSHHVSMGTRSNSTYCPLGWVMLFASCNAAGLLGAYVDDALWRVLCM